MSLKKIIEESEGRIELIEVSIHDTDQEIAQSITDSLKAAVQVDHLTDEEVDEVAAILDRMEI